MLIGIVKKNAIMMIDFAIEAERNHGKSARESILEAASVRFRPIMMTTMAALVGTLPIALGHGAGAESRRPLGIAVVGGLAFSQLITLYITPVIYTYLDALQQRFGRRDAREGAGDGSARRSWRRSGGAGADGPGAQLVTRASKQSAHAPRWQDDSASVSPPQISYSASYFCRSDRTSGR